MSEKNRRGGINRREFMKVSAAAVGGVASLAGVMPLFFSEKKQKGYCLARLLCPYAQRRPPHFPIVASKNTTVNTYLT